VSNSSNGELYAANAGDNNIPPIHRRPTERARHRTISSSNPAQEPVGVAPAALRSTRRAVDLDGPPSISFDARKAKQTPKQVTDCIWRCRSGCPRPIAGCLKSGLRGERPGGELPGGPPQKANYAKNEVCIGKDHEYISEIDDWRRDTFSEMCANSRSRPGADRRNGNGQGRRLGLAMGSSPLLTRIKAKQSSPSTRARICRSQEAV
jgi:hypothetical protein